MFTGIIEGIGRVVDLQRLEDSAVLVLDAGDLVTDLAPGGSLAVNGVCLTSSVDEAPVTGFVRAPTQSGAPAASAPGTGRFVAEVMGETLRLTGLGALGPGDPVNLERCTEAGGRFDGHIVQGHVDGVGAVLARTDHAEWTTLRIGIPGHLAPFTAVKGSIALNGVSLTLTAVSESDAPISGAWVEVGLIPATLSHTTFGEAEVGDPVNLEVDVIAKYAARLLAFSPAASAIAVPSTATTQGAEND